MGFWDVFEGIKRWIWIVAAVILCSVIIATVLSCFFINTVYEAKTTVLINNENDSDFQLTENVLKSYSTLLYSDLVLNKTKNKLRINSDTDKIRSLIKIETIQDTGFLKITVGNSSPKVARDIANTIVENLQSEADKIGLSGSVIIIDKAITPLAPERPNLPLNIFVASIAGLMVGITLTFLLANIEDLMEHSIASIKKQNIPLIGIVPKFQKNRISDQKDKAYQRIRSKVSFLCAKNSYQVVLITSQGFSEGKTFTAVNLAISLGQIGKKVLLIDCNLRTPSLHSVFELENEKGVAWHLAHGDEKSFDIQSTQHMNLDVMVCGTLYENPVELLKSQTLAQIIDFGRSNYDLVIIDSAPFYPFDDTRILAKQTDAAILVTDYRKTKVSCIKDLYKKIQTSGFNMLGIVINRMRYQEKHDKSK